MTTPNIFASGLRKHLYMGPETTWGTLANNDATAFEKIRVSSSMSLAKQSFNSNQIRPSAQLQFTAQGVRSAAGTVQGEVAPKDWSQTIAALLRTTLVAGISKSNTDFGGTLAATAASASFTCSASDFVTEGFRQGDLFTLTGTASNTGQNFRILAFSNLNKTITVSPAPVDMTAQNTFTMAVTGKKAVTGVAPSVDQSFTIEHWHADISQSERFLGCKVGGCSISVPVQQYNTISFQFTGKDRAVNAAQYFAAASVHTDLGLAAGLHTVVSINGVDTTTVTSLSLSIQPQMAPTQTIGSNSLASIVPGMFDVSGNFTAYFTDEVIDGYYDQEVEVPIDIYMPVAGGAGAPKFVKFFMPTCKFASGSTQDSQTNLTKSFQFRARLDTTSTIADMSTVIYQDSDA